MIIEGFTQLQFIDCYIYSCIMPKRTKSVTDIFVKARLKQLRDYIVLHSSYYDSADKQKKLTLDLWQYAQGYLRNQKIKIRSD